MSLVRVHGVSVALSSSYEATLRSDAVVLAVIGLALLLWAAVISGRGRGSDADEPNGRNPGVRRAWGVRPGIAGVLFLAGGIALYLVHDVTFF